MTLPTSGSISLEQVRVEVGAPAGSFELVNVYTQRLTGKTNPVLPTDFYGKGRAIMYWSANNSTSLTINETDSNVANGVIETPDGHPTQDPDLYPLKYEIVVLPPSGVTSDFTISDGTAYSLIYVQFNSPTEFTKTFSLTAVADEVTEGNETFTVYLNQIITNGNVQLRNRTAVTAAGNQTTLSLTVLDTSFSLDYRYLLNPGQYDYNLNCLDFCISKGFPNSATSPRARLTVDIYGVLGSIDPTLFAFCTNSIGDYGREWAKTPSITVNIYNATSTGPGAIPGIITGAGGSVSSQSAISEGLGRNFRSGGGAMVTYVPITINNLGIIQGGGASGDPGDNGIGGGGAGYYVGVGRSDGYDHPGPANGSLQAGGSIQDDEGKAGGANGGFGGGWVIESGRSFSNNGYGGRAGRDSTSLMTSYSQEPGPYLCAYGVVTWVSLGTLRGGGNCGLSYPFNRNYSNGAATISYIVPDPPPPPPYYPPEPVNG